MAFEMTGMPEAFETALSLTRMGGSVVLVGSVFPSRPVPVFAEQLVRRCLTVCGIHNYRTCHLRSALAVPELTAVFTVPRPGHVMGAAHRFPRALARPLPTDRLRLGVRPERRGQTHRLTLALIAPDRTHPDHLFA